MTSDVHPAKLYRDPTGARQQVLLFCLEQLQNDLKHRWNGPFHSVGLNLSLLKRISRPGAPAKLVQRSPEWIEDIESEMKRLHKNLHHFFDLLVPPASQEPEVLDSHDLWPRAESLLAGTAQRRQARIEWNATPQPGQILARPATPLLAVVGLNLYVLETQHQISWQIPSHVSEQSVHWQLTCPAPIPESSDLEAIDALLQSDGGKGTLQTPPGHANAYEIRWTRSRGDAVS